MDKTDTYKCTKCHLVKPNNLFYKCKAIKRGRRSTCKACDANKMRAYKAADPEKYRNYVRVWHKKNPAKIAALKRKSAYGITQKDYDDILLKQNGVCAICKRPCASGRRLAVDHCHSSDKVRGLLCSKCNMGIGMANESVSTLTAMIEYIRAFDELMRCG